MKKLLRLWSDTRGYSSGISLVLVVTILGLGAIAGLATVRDQLNQELGDVASSLRCLDQSFAAPCYGTFQQDWPADWDDQPQQAPAGISFESSEQ